MHYDHYEVIILGTSSSHPRLLNGSSGISANDYRCLCEEFSARTLAQIRAMKTVNRKSFGIFTISQMKIFISSGENTRQLEQQL